MEDGEKYPPQTQPQHMNPAVNLPTRLAGKAQAFMQLRFRINLAGQAGFGGVHREGRSKAEGISRYIIFYFIIILF